MHDASRRRAGRSKSSPEWEPQGAGRRSRRRPHSPRRPRLHATFQPERLRYPTIPTEPPGSRTGRPLRRVNRRPSIGPMLSISLHASSRWSIRPSGRHPNSRRAIDTRPRRIRLDVVRGAVGVSAKRPSAVAFKRGARPLPTLGRMNCHLPVASDEESLAPTPFGPRARLRRIPNDGRFAVVAENHEWSEGA